MHTLFRSRNARARITGFAALSLPLLMSGCSGVLQTRWSQPSDTVAVWSPRMESLPLDVHQAGGEPVAAFPSVGQTPALPTAQRIVVYVGGHEIPTPESYCQANAELYPVPAKHGVMVAAALCDGTRLVDIYRGVYSASDIQAKGWGPVIKTTKSKLLWGLSYQSEFSDFSYN